MPRAPWERARGVSVALARWRSDPALRHDLVLDHTLAPRGGDTVPLPDALSPARHTGVAPTGAAVHTPLQRPQLETSAPATITSHPSVATPLQSP